MALLASTTETPVPLVEIENELKRVLCLTPDFNEETLLDWGWERSKIRQAYPQPKPHPRYRREKFDNKENLYTTNIKEWSEEDNAKLETEGITNKPTFKSAWKEAAPDTRLKKRRFTKTFGDEEWVIDFFHDKKNGTYFIMAEVEMPKGREEPKTIPMFLHKNTLFIVPKTDNRFTSRKLCDPEYAAKIIDTLQPKPNIAA